MRTATRRGILSAMAIAPVVIASPATAMFAQGKAEAAFADWKATRHALNTSTDDDVLEDPNHPIWSRLKRAEHIIRDSKEVGARVAEIRLWVSLTSDLLYTAEQEALQREDVDWLIVNADDPEFSTVMALRAIKALRS